MDEQRPIPTRVEMAELVRQAGSSHEGFFRYPIRSDGLYLQQDPEEFAAFVHFMATEVGQADLTLDLGIASGGQTKFLRDWFPCRRTIIVDDGRHEMFPHWARIKPEVRTEFVTEIISDSHLPAVRAQLAAYENSLDFAFVDGDHSYKGLRQDIFMVTPLLKEGAVMALHDTAAVWDCKRVFDDLLRSPNFTLLRNFDNRFGISLWQRLPRRKPTKWVNHAFGWGRL
ncbi:MAG: class I SAM-dependent methyltransferase [Pseudomonadota bacterium]